MSAKTTVRRRRKPAGVHRARRTLAVPDDEARPALHGKQICTAHGVFILDRGCAVCRIYELEDRLSDLTREVARILDLVERRVLNFNGVT